MLPLPISHTYMSYICHIFSGIYSYFLGFTVAPIDIICATQLLVALRDKTASPLLFLAAVFTKICMFFVRRTLRECTDSATRTNNKSLRLNQGFDNKLQWSLAVSICSNTSKSSYQSSSSRAMSPPYTKT